MVGIVEAKIARAEVEAACGVGDVAVRGQRDAGMRRDRRVEIDADAAQPGRQADLVERQAFDGDVEVARRLRRAPGQRADRPSAVRPVDGQAQLRAAGLLVEGDVEAVEDGALPGGSIVDHEAAADDADAIHGGDRAVAAGQIVEKAAERRGRLLHDDGPTGMRDRRLRGRRDDRQRRHDGQAVASGPRRQGERSVRVDDQAQLDVEELEPARRHAADDEGQRVDRYFGERRGENGVAGTAVKRQSVDRQRRPVAALGDGGLADVEMEVPAETRIERRGDLRAEPGDDDGSLAQAGDEHAGTEQTEDREAREQRQTGHAQAVRQLAPPPASQPNPAGLGRMCSAVLLIDQTCAAFPNWRNPRADVSSKMPRLASSPSATTWSAGGGMDLGAFPMAL